MNRVTLEEYIGIAKGLPPPRQPKLVTQLNDLNFMRCMCGHSKRKSDLPPRHSGIVHFKDNICRGCISQAKDWATVVCVRCQEVVAKMEPIRAKDGFTFKRNGVYHTLNCASCCPGLESVEIVERILWLRNSGKPTPTPTPT
jgi:hypothetical protein